jgi:hypothetical protein
MEQKITLWFWTISIIAFSRRSIQTNRTNSNLGDVESININHDSNELICR